MAEQSLKDKTAKGLFWGGISNGALQVVGLLVGIILMKLLSPDDYGLVGLLAIFSGVASTLQESGFTMALVNRPRFEHKDYNAVFWFSSGISVLMYLILFFSAPLIADFYGKQELVSLARVSFLTFVFVSTATAHNALLVKQLKVKERAIINIVSIVLAGIVAVTLALNGLAYWTLVIQQLVYTGVWTILCWFYSGWRPTFSWDMRPLKEMFGFSFKILSSSLVTQVHNNIFSVLLGKFNTVTNVGYFSQGTKWANMGSLLISGMVTSVAQPVFVEVQEDKERIVQVFRKMLRFIAFVTFPLMLGFAFVGREFICLINENWLPSVPILQMYCVVGTLTQIQILYSQLLASQGRSDFYFWCTIAYAIVQIGVASWTLRYGIYWMAFSNMIVSFFYLGAWHVFVSRILPIRLFHVCKDIMPYLVIMLVGIVCAWFAMRPVESIFLSFFGKVVIVAFVYLVAMWKLDSVIFKESIGFFFGKRT